MSSMNIMDAAFSLTCIDNPQLAGIPTHRSTATWCLRCQLGYLMNEQLCRRFLLMPVFTDATCASQWIYCKDVQYEVLDC